MALFENLQLWLDPKLRDGPEAMAADEWLLAKMQLPTLRVYRWAGAWASIGYFGKFSQVEDQIVGVNWVRRWTGGGVVDHRFDWTYSLIVPDGFMEHFRRAAESYRAIHAALSQALLDDNIDARMQAVRSEMSHDLCFENPVVHDLVDSHGRKLAGAGQRRTRDGLLHQGSVAISSNKPERAWALARHLSNNQIEIFPELPSHDLELLVERRYLPLTPSVQV